MPSSSVSYRTLFSLPGGTFVAVSALARLPLAMSQLGTLLLVSSPQVSGLSLIHISEPTRPY